MCQLLHRARTLFLRILQKIKPLTFKDMNSITQLLHKWANSIYFNIFIWLVIFWQKSKGPKSAVKEQKALQIIPRFESHVRISILKPHVIYLTEK